MSLPDEALNEKVVCKECDESLIKFFADSHRCDPAVLDHKRKLKQIEEYQQKKKREFEQQ
jgi:hypothetical protein